MAEIIACPRCSANLVLPSGARQDAYLQCPQCQESFSPASAKAVNLAQAVVVPAPDSKEAESVENVQAKSPQAKSPQAKSPQANPSEPAFEEPVGVESVDESPVGKQTPATDKPGLPTIDFVADEPAGPTPLGTLSDWIDSERPKAPETLQPENEGPGKAGPAEREQEPSLESLLNSFRGEAISKPTNQPANPPPASADVIDDQQDEPACSRATLSGIETIANFAPVQPQQDQAETFTPETASARATAAKPAAVLKQDLRQPTPTQAAHSPNTPFEDQLPLDRQPTDPQPTGEGSAEAMPTTPPRQTYRSPAIRRLLLKPAAVATSGLLGLLTGYLGLLWIGGPGSDLLGVARLAPGWMLPATFAQASDPPPEAPGEPDAPLAAKGLARSPASPGASVERASYEELLAVKDSAANTVVNDETPAEPFPLAGPPPNRSSGVGEVQLLDAPGPYTIAQLEQLLEDAEQARRQMSEASLADDPAAAKQLGAAYAQLCHFANVLTFVDSPTNQGSMTMLEAKEVFQRLFQYQHARNDARDMANRWIAWPNRAHGGVFLVGSLVSGKQQGSVYQYRVKLGTGPTVAVLTPKPIRYNRFLKADAIGVVGSIVDAPAKRVEGYEGQAKQAIWAGHTISLGAPKFE